MIKELLTNKSAEEKATIKGEEIAKIVALQIEIVVRVAAHHNKARLDQALGRSQRLSIAPCILLDYLNINACMGERLQYQVYFLAMLGYHYDPVYPVGLEKINLGIYQGNPLYLGKRGIVMVTVEQEDCSVNCFLLHAFSQKKLYGLAPAPDH